MTKQPEKGWWEEDLVALLNCEYTGEQHNFMRKVIAEATRRGKVEGLSDNGKTYWDAFIKETRRLTAFETWMEAKEIINALITEPENGVRKGNNIACEYAIKLINSRIQQYGKEE